MDSKQLDAWLKRCDYAEKCVLYNNQHHECMYAGKECKLYSIYETILQRKNQVCLMPELTFNRDVPPLTIEHKVEGGPDGSWRLEK
jgi:hypothetical protein